MHKHEKYGGRVTGGESRCCEWADCPQAGEFRAPRKNTSAADLAGDGIIADSPREDYLWFCLDHVREYNAGYNYFAGLSDADADRFQREDATWHRPTWPFAGPFAANPRGFEARPIDPLDIFDGVQSWSVVDGATHFDRPLNGKDRQALSTLGLDAGAAPPDIKARFKSLVKELHPDLNGGDRSCEDRLRNVIAAYNHLSEALAT